MNSETEQEAEDVRPQERTGRPSVKTLFAAGFTAVAISLGGVACGDDEEGPVEDAGKAVDEAAGDVSNAADDAGVDEAADDVGDAAGDAADDVGGAAEEGAEDAGDAAEEGADDAGNAADEAENDVDDDPGAGSGDPGSDD